MVSKRQYKDLSWKADTTETKDNQKLINELAEKYNPRPKIIGHREENGIKIAVYEAR